MNTHDIEAFVAVVETGSISAAAARLNLTQPGITRRVQNLELTVGASLLDRVSKPLKPTSAGREAYELGRRVLRSVDDLKSGLAPNGVPSGEFRIGVTPAIGEITLATPIDVVRSAYPSLSLRVTSAWSPALIRQVEIGALHAAAILTVFEAEPSEPLQATPLGAMDLVVAASKHLRLPRRPDMEAASVHPWIVNPEGCGTRRGIGLALVQAWTVAHNPHRKELVTFRVSGLPQAVNGWVVHGPSLGKLSQPVELFRTAFAASLKSVERAAASRGPRSR